MSAEVKLIEYPSESGPALILKSEDGASGHVYFKLNCDDSNRLEATITNLGFPPDVIPTPVVVGDSDYAAIQENLIGEALYCKKPNGEATPQAPNTAPPSAPATPTFTNAYRLVKYLDAIYAYNPKKKELYKIGCNGFREGVELALLDDKPYGLATPLFNLASKKEVKCYSGKLNLNPQAPQFVVQNFEATILAGSKYHYTVAVTDPDGDTVSVFLKDTTCPWLSFNPDTLEVLGESYPSTMPYSCLVTLGALAEKDFADKDFTLNVKVDPIRIKSVTAGYRRTCALLTNGKVACWGSGDSTAGNLFKQYPALAGSDFIAANKSIETQTKGIYFTKAKQVWFLRDGASNPDLLGDADSSNITALKASRGPACVQMQDNTVKCFGDDRDGYVVPSDTAAYPRFDFQLDSFCRETVAANGTIRCLYPDIGLTLGSANRQFAAGDTQICGVTSAGTIQCASRDANDQIVRNAPTANVFKKVVLGSNFGCALTRDGKVLCWGANTTGQSNTGDPTLKDLLEGSPLTDVILGLDHSCSISVNSQIVICWGGQFFNGITDGINGVPHRVTIGEMIPELAGWDVFE